MYAEKKKRQWQAHACCTARKTNKGRLPRIIAGNSWPTQHWSFMHTANGWLLQIRLYRENNDPAIGGGSVALHSLRTLTPTFISTPRPSSKGVRKKREHRAARLPPQATQEKRSAARLLSQTMGTQEIHATVPGMEKKMKLPCCRTHAAMAAADAPRKRSWQGVKKTTV
jgi:hypothetical protein